MPIMFKYAVKYHGKYYPAGADIPDAAPVVETPWKYEGPETSTEEAAQKAAESAENAAAEAVDGECGANTPSEPKAAQKAAKGRKKGDA